MYRVVRIWVPVTGMRTRRDVGRLARGRDVSHRGVHWCLVMGLNFEEEEEDIRAAPDVLPDVFPRMMGSMSSIGRRWK